MKRRIPPEQVAHYKKTMDALVRFAENVPPEVFKWIGWVTAIAAVKVVAIRTGTWWLTALSVALTLLLLARINWFVSLKNPEIQEADGAITVHFSRWRILLGICIGVAAWLLAFGAAREIAHSDLLPGTDAAQQTRSTPSRGLSL